MRHLLIWPVAVFWAYYACAILAWVFASWTRPFAVMVMIPFGLIGAVVGHYVMGLNLNILSLFALIALSGIVVNNSIILVATIERRMDEIDGPPEQAIVQGTVDQAAAGFADLNDDDWRFVDIDV